jgi:hypothetical protein
MTLRLFTPAEANETLPLVRRIVRDILDRGKRLRALVEDSGAGRGSDAVRAAERELRAFMAELEQIGCSFKDWSFETGLVDFPAEIDGRPVYLCWRSDEPSVGWYHPVEAGFAARRPIPDSLLQESARSCPTSSG